MAKDVKYLSLNFNYPKFHVNDVLYTNGNGNNKIFTGNEILETAYYIRDITNYNTLVTTILPSLENFTNINIVIPDDRGMNVLLEYIELLNITNINFIKTNNIKEIKEIKKLPIRNIRGKKQFLNLRWLLKYRGLVKTPFKFDKIVVHHATGNVMPDEILIFLKSQGFFICVLEDTPIQDQINLFAGAKQIVATYGASLVNTIYCKNGCKVLEMTLNGDNYYERYINNITNQLAPKTKLIYDQIKDTDLQCFIQKYNQYLVT
jgi:capsular polysaccharide biosynthesis protein